ncbi:hypothetical protein HO173_001467 [Letharia columbiana]|uniref:Uncharacterized protein n=1 Tax=Letharia columbiana TaxID=112416 RepID=A0A8H6G549_9LECA|nr:uncharacterized protein HO173_001467 [Letharia columbiana]KAF6240794.1 hypothetical protein HO173_001467 [Letharia columbiana]
MGRRFLKDLAAMGSIYDRGPNEFVPTSSSKALQEPMHRDAYPTVFVSTFVSDSTINSGADLCVRLDLSDPNFFAFPEPLYNSQYKNLDNPVDGAIRLGHGPKDHLFEWLSQRPELLSQFQNHMARYYTGRRSWMYPNFYLVEKNLVEGAQTEYDAVFLVDVGGGKGQGLQELYRKHPRGTRGG